MKQINENELSEFMRELLTEAALVVSPGQVKLFINDQLPPGINAQTVVESNGDHTIYIREETLSDEYSISHEILHICVRKVVPCFIRFIEPSLIGMIGLELQGYLEHNWILAEQKRRGLEIDELRLYADIETTLRSDQEGLPENINSILTLNNILHTHPKVYEELKEFFQKNNPKSLEISHRIMSHYPKQDLYANYEARKATVQAIREWNNIFAENGLNSVNLKVFLSVTPVFSIAQLKRMAGVILGLIPNAIINHEKQVSSHVLFTMNDGQCCVVFSMDENGLKGLQGYLNKMTLEEFLEMAKIPCLAR